MKFDTVRIVTSAGRSLGWGLMSLACLAPLQLRAAESAQPWTLQATLLRAQEANRDVLTARRAVDAAQADLRSASVTPAPQLSFLSQAINTQNLGHGGVWNRPVDTIVRLDTLLERGGKRTHREQLAQAGVQAAQSDVADALRVQQVAAAQAYWDLKLAQVQHEAAQANAQIAQESSRIAELRARNGDLSRLDATRLSMETDRALNEAELARSELHRAQTALAQLLALDKQAQVLAADPWPALPASGTGTGTGTGGDLADADETWLSGRADVVAARQRLTQAQEVLALAQAQRATDVTWTVQFEHNPPVGNHLWGVGVAFPLGVAGRQDGPIARAVVLVSEAQATVERTEANARAEQAVLRATLVAASRRIARLDTDLVPKAREAVKAAEFARQQGALSLQDVLDTRRLAHAAELDAAQAHADHAKALAAMNLTSTLTSNPTVVTP